MTPQPAATQPAAPPLAAFPKAFMQALCKDGSMPVSDWIRLAVLSFMFAFAEVLWGFGQDRLHRCSGS